MSDVLNFVSGVCWSLVYILAIIQGIRNRTWCIPQLAICQNFAWEFWIVCFRVQAGQPIGLQYAVQIAWLVLDIGVLATWLIFDKCSEKRKINKSTLLLFVFFLMYLLTFKFQLWGVSAYLINTIMSIAFVWRIKQDKGAWTNISIALFKLIGTLAPTIGFGILNRDPIIFCLGFLCLIFDIYYLIVLYRGKERSELSCTKKVVQARN